MFFFFLTWARYFAAADGFVVQTGDPEGPAEGFIDPSTEKTRTIPLELMVEGEKAPVYGETLEVSFSEHFTILSLFPLPLMISVNTINDAMKQKKKKV